MLGLGEKRRQPRDVADLTRLLTAQNEEHSLASRSTRDEVVRRSQSDDLESSERIWQWLEHVVLTVGVWLMRSVFCWRVSVCPWLLLAP